MHIIFYRIMATCNSLFHVKKVKGHDEGHQKGKKHIFGPYLLELNDAQKRENLEFLDILDQGLHDYLG